MFISSVTQQPSLSKVARILCSLTFLCLALPAPAATIVTWNNSYSTWNTASNWSPGVIPNNTQAEKFEVVMGGGGATLASDITVSVLRHNGGDLTGNYALTVTDGYHLAGGNRGIDLARLQFASSSVNTWTASGLSLYGTGRIVNAGTFTFAAANNNATVDFLNLPFQNLATGLFIKNSAQASLTVNGLFTNASAVQHNAGVILFNSGLLQTAGEYRVGLSGTVRGSARIEGGTLGGTGTINLYGDLPVTTGGSVDAGLTTGTAGLLTITNRLDLSGGGVLHIDLGGTVAGTSYDQVTSGNYPLLTSGVLQLTLLAGFTPVGTDQFIVFRALSSTLAGSFANVANGQRLFTTDGRGSFRVDYGTGANTSRVLVTDFQAIPEPGTLALLLPFALIATSRRSSRLQRV